MASYQISFSFCKRFHIFAFLHVFFLFSFSHLSILDLARPRPEDSLHCRAALLGPLCFREGTSTDYFHGTRFLRSGSKCGTEGATLLVFTTPFLPGLVTNNRFSDRFGSSGLSIGHENLRPRFGIMMMHFGLSHVVRYDFCCLLSCCCFAYEILISKGFLNWSWTRISS